MYVPKLNKSNANYSSFRNIPCGKSTQGLPWVLGVVGVGFVPVIVRPPPSLQLADRVLLPPVNVAIVPQSQVVPFPEGNVSGFLSMTPTSKR